MKNVYKILLVAMFSIGTFLILLNVAWRYSTEVKAFTYVGEDGLVANWDFETNFTDTTGNFPGETLYNGGGGVPTRVYNATRGGYVVSLTGGATKYINVPDPNGWFGYKSPTPGNFIYSVEAYVNPTATNAFQRVVAKTSVDQVNSGQLWILGVTDAGATGGSRRVYCGMCFVNEPNPACNWRQIADSNTPPVPTNQWTKIGCVYDGTYLKAMHSDQIVATLNVSGLQMQQSTSYFRIGAQNNGWDQFVGYIDDIKVYNEAKTYDFEAPTVASTQTTISTSRDVALVSGTATDNATVSGVEFQLDSTSGSWTPCTCDDGSCNEASEDYQCSISGVTTGSHTVYVRAYDDSSNYTAEVDYLQYMVEGVVLSQNLVGHWEMEDYAQISDSVGLLDDGVVTGSISQVTGPTGLGNGVNITSGSVITVPDPQGEYSFDEQNGSTFTVSAYVKKTSFTGSYGVIAQKLNNNNSEIQWAIGHESNGGVWCRIKTDTDFYQVKSADHTPEKKLVNGEWNQVACVYDGTTLTAVLNGMEVDSASVPENLPNISAGNFIIGKGWNNVDPINGAVDDIRIYNNAVEYLPLDVIPPVIKIDSLEEAYNHLDTTPLFTGTITDDAVVASAEYYITTQYYIVAPDDVDNFSWQALLPVDGTWDESEEQFSFESITLSNNEWYLYMRATDEYGNKSYYNHTGWLTNSCGGSDSCMAYYRFQTIGVDTRSPIVYTDDVIPDPSNNTNPYYYGHAVDDDAVATNNIVAIFYSINESDEIQIPALDGSYNSADEAFKLELSLEYGEYDISICAEDALGHQGCFYDSFVIGDVDVPDAEIVTKVESFSTVDYKDEYATTGLWGNGSVRLKQEVTFSEELKLFTNSSEMGYLYGNRKTKMDKGLGDSLWLCLNDGRFMHYDTSTDTYTYYPQVLAFQYPEQITEFEFGGGTYLLIKNTSASSVIYDTNGTLDNVSDDSFTDLFATYNGDAGVAPFSIVEEDGHAVIYGSLATTYGLGRSGYAVRLDLGTDMLNTADDSSYVWGAADGLGSDAILGYYDQDQSVVLLSRYYSGSDIVICYLNDTPSNKTDDTCYTSNMMSAAYSATKDSNGDYWFAGNYYLKKLDINDPALSGDDVWVSMYNSWEMENTYFWRVYTYPSVGPVGDEVWMTTREGDIWGVDTNGTYSTSSYYTNQYDDTIFHYKLPSQYYTSELAVSTIMQDKDTFWIFMPSSGLFKINLVRGFEVENLIDIKPTPPTGVLEVNHIKLDYVEGSYELGSGVPTSMRAGIRDVYFLASNDDGQSWYPIEIGETVDFPTSDFHLKFRMILLNSNGTTPVIDEVGLSYAEYPEDSGISSTLHLAYPALVSVGDSFDLTVYLKDMFDFTPPWDGNVDLGLFLSANPALVSDCISFSDPVYVSNGAATTTATALCAGTYFFNGMAYDGKSTTGANIQVVGSACGNDVVEGSEECDGSVGILTCEDFAFDSGDLTCTSSCEFDTSICETSEPPTTPSVCGNGIIEPGEQCDGNVTYLECSDIGDYTDGVLDCTSLCKLDYSDCKITEESDVSEEPDNEPGTIIDEIEDIINADDVSVSDKFLNILGIILLEIAPYAILASFVYMTLGLMNATFADLPGIMLQSFFNLFHWIGIRKKGKPYGMVYNAVTKEPITQAIVRIFTEGGRLVTTAVTDSYGIFSVQLEPNRYYIKAFKGGFNFPSKLIVGTQDGKISNVYHGEVHDVEKRQEVLLAIPLDPKKNQLHTVLRVVIKNRMQIAAKFVQLGLFVLGFYLAVLVYNAYPNPLHLVAVVLYSVSTLLLLISTLQPQPKYGTVYNVSRPQPDVEIRLFETEFNDQVASRVSDLDGFYRFLVPPSDYKLKVSDSLYSMDKDHITVIQDKTPKNQPMVVAKDIKVKPKNIES